MKSIYVTSFVILSVLLFMVSPIYGQQSYKLFGTQKLTVSGTSTIHDWQMVARDNSNGTAELTIENGKLVSIQSMTIEMPVKSLKSGKGGMDNNAYEALKEKKYPSVKFVMSEFISVTGNSVKVKGKLIIAGTEKSILLEATYAVNGGSIRFKGVHDIAFTDFKIDPPTAVFGTIKTGDKLTLGFETSFSPIN